MKAPSAQKGEVSMKRFRLLAVLGALALCTATVVWGDYNVLDKSTYYQNATNGARTNSTGDLRVDDMSRDRNNFSIVNVCDDTLSNGANVSNAWANAGGAFAFTAESSIVITSYPYRRFTLMLRAIPAGGDTTNRILRLAVQIRKHTDATGDSASTFAWTSWTNAALIATADSAGYGTNIGPNGALPYSNEKVIDLDLMRGRGTGAANQSNGSWPDGIAVDLQDSRGQWFWAPYMSVRVRVIGFAGSGKPRVICKLAMGS